MISVGKIPSGRGRGAIDAVRLQFPRHSASIPILRKSLTAGPCLSMIHALQYQSNFASFTRAGALVAEDLILARCSYRPMNRILFVCVMALLGPLAHAVDITIGSTRLTIPAPSGYAPLTSEMKPYAEISQRYVSPTDEQFALFLSSGDIALAAKGETPKLARRFAVQTSKVAIQQVVSNRDFAEIKRWIKLKNQELRNEAEVKNPGLIEWINRTLARDHKVDSGLSLTQMVPLPPHYESDCALAYSTIVKYNMADKDGKPAEFVAAVTMTYVHVEDKFLILVTSAGISDLEWSRTASRKWVDAVIAANPSGGATGNPKTR